MAILQPIFERDSQTTMHFASLTLVALSALVSQVICSPLAGKRSDLTSPVNLPNGTEHAHEPCERVSVEALEGNLSLVLALVEEAASGLAAADST